MIDKYIKVEDMPAAVREACMERGFFDCYEMTVKQAMTEWAAWEIGDAAWGSDAAEYVSAMILGK